MSKSESDRPTAAEILTAGYLAFNSRDKQRLRELLTDDFRWNEAEEVPGRKVCTSAAEFLEYLDGFDLLWEDFSFEPIELTATESGAIVAKVRGLGRGKASGQQAELLIHHVWRLRGARVARMDAFLDEREAADAAAGPAVDPP